MKCDLHVHTIHLGRCIVPGLSRVCLESCPVCLESCCNEPRALYEVLKRRGMNLATVTDHDSIDAEEFRKHPDFSWSEEVPVTLPGGTEMRAGVYGIREHDPVDLQRCRTDTESLLACAFENRLFVTVNHAHSSLTGRRVEEDYDVFARGLHSVEVAGGHMPARANQAFAWYRGQRTGRKKTGIVEPEGGDLWLRVVEL
jgi:hypothetical protein